MVGSDVVAEPQPLDASFPEWGQSRYFRVTLSATTRLSQLLGHLYVLVPVRGRGYRPWNSRASRVLCVGEMSGHILLVDHDRDLRNFLSKAFREEGYGVTESDAGDRGFELLLNGTYNCIVLEVMLPGRDGFSVVAELRARRAATPVLLLTARDDLASRVRGLEDGADDCLTKPFDLAELLARVHALIRRAEMRHADTALQVGDLVLEPLTRRVKYGARRVDLSPREFTLLEFLMRNANRTVSRSRIAAAVWNYQFDPGTNVVDVYVNYLRHKLSVGGRTTGIRTVRGVGYRLERAAP